MERNFDIVLTSSLRRAMQTSELMFPNFKSKFIVIPPAFEILGFTSEISVEHAKLRQEFEPRGFDFNLCQSYGNSDMLQLNNLTDLETIKKVYDRLEENKNAADAFTEMVREK